MVKYLLENYKVTAQIDMIHHSQIGYKATTMKYPCIQLKPKIQHGNYISFINVNDTIRFKNDSSKTNLVNAMFDAELGDKYNTIEIEEILDEILKHNAQNGKTVNDVPKQFVKYCNQYLDVDEIVAERQCMKISKYQTKIKCGHRFLIKNLKQFKSNNWLIDVTIIPYDTELITEIIVKKATKDKEAIVKYENGGYDYENSISLCITKQDKKMNEIINRLYIDIHIPAKTISLLSRMSISKIYKTLEKSK